MRLLDCRLSSIRRHKDLELSFHPGLTLITGANESGKSSLVEALHRTLFLRSTATGTPVQRLRSLQHSGHPQVNLRFEARGRSWTLQKRFSGQSGTTSLHGQGDSTRLGSEAEDWLAGLLGVEEIIGSRQANRVLPSRWAHLWVMQGDAGRDLLQLGGEHYDLRGLIEQLEQRADAALQSPLDQHLHDQLEQLVNSSITSRGVRTQSRLWQTEQLLQESRLRLETAEAEQLRFEQASAELDALDDERRQLEQQQPQLEAERLRVQNDRRNHDQEQSARTALERQLKPLELQHQQVQLIQRRLQQTDQALTLKRQQLAQMEGEISRIKGDQAQLQLAVQEHQGHRDQQEQERARLEQQGHHLRRLEERLQLEERLGQLERECLKLENWQRQQLEISQALQDLQAPPVEKLALLQEQQRQLEALTIRKDAMASVVTLETSDQEVLVNNTPLLEGQPQHQTSTFSLTIGKGVKLRIQPGGGEGLETIARDQQQLQQSLEKALEQWNATTLKTIESRCQQRQELLTRQSLLNQQRPEAQTTESLINEQSATRERLHALMQELADDEDQANPDPASLNLQDRNAIQQALVACRTQYRLVNDKGQTVRQRLTTLEQQLANQSQQHQTLQLQREGLIAETRSLDQQLQTLIQDQGDADSLTTTQKELEAQITELHRQLERLGTNADSQVKAAMLEQKENDLQRKERSLQDKQQAISTQRGGLLERCSSLGRNDPYAKVEEARTLLNQAEVSHQNEWLQVRAHQHLLQLFEVARSDLSSRYTAPLSTSIAQFLSPLLEQPEDACTLHYNAKEGLGGLTLQRDGLPLPFASLSGGMKEQLNAALRLAMADTLRSGHDGCLPVLFDDAFTNSDPNRLQAVRTMLRQAVDRGLQVVVLSCDGEPYRSIADAVVELS